MADIFNEISDDIRDQKLAQFWKENGGWIIGGALMAVVLTGTLTFWRQWEHKRNMAATAEVTRLVAAADLPKLEAFADKSNKNHAMIARFITASAYLEQGKKDQAIALYDKIAQTSGIDRTWRELAQVFSISHRLDKDTPAMLEKQLAKLSGNKNTWRYTARELEAVLAAKQGNLQKAADALRKITSDPAAPANARARAFTLLEFYTGDIKPLNTKKTDPKT